MSRSAPLHLDRRRRAAWMARLLATSLLLLAGCAARGERDAPLPQLRIPARVTSEPDNPPLVVLLPGRRDSIESMRAAGAVEAIQQAWPQAEVVLVGATLGHYMDGGIDARLQREVIEPARRRGIGELWLAGASLGGMGALLYDRAHPGGADGIVLLAPFLGSRSVLREIEAAGGIASWQPGPPQPIDADTFEVEVWRHLAGWRDQPAAAARVWLGYGDRDRLRRAVPLLAPVLRPEQVLERPGGHRWSVWTPLLGEIFSAVIADRAE